MRVKIKKIAFSPTKLGIYFFSHLCNPPLSPDQAGDEPGGAPPVLRPGEAARVQRCSRHRADRLQPAGGRARALGQAGQGQEPAQGSQAGGHRGEVWEGRGAGGAQVDGEFVGMHFTLLSLIML